MKTNEEIEKAKSIDIRIVLKELGIPFKIVNDEKVVFKKDGIFVNASAIYSLEKGLWLWKDFNLKKGGTPLDLYLYVTRKPFSIAVDDLLMLQTNDNDEEAKIIVIKEEDSFLNKQIEYLQKRHVWPVPKEVKNIKYKAGGKVWYGIGIKTVNNHYVVRQATDSLDIRYINIGNLDIAFWNRNSDVTIITEGMFDAMSIDKLEAGKYNILILNSVANVKKAISYLLETRTDDKIILALDNDKAGVDASLFLKEVFDNAEYYIYTGKDPNEFLIQKEENQLDNIWYNMIS